MKPYMWDVCFTEETSTFRQTYREQDDMEKWVRLHKLAGFTVEVTELFTREQIEGDKP